MIRLTIQQQQQRAFSTLKPYFNEFGFKKQTYQNIKSSLVTETKFGLIYLYFNFKSTGHTEFSLGLSFFEIEKTLMEIGNPNVDFSADLSIKDYSRGTLYDTQNILNYDIQQRPTLINENVDEYAHAVISYMERHGWAFIQRYSYLPNVLVELDRLDKEGKYWNHILNGLADYLLRGLMISKLCNDISFDEKVRICDHKFYHLPHLQNWIPYYKSFKEKLSNIVPEYNTTVV